MTVTASPVGVAPATVLVELPPSSQGPEVPFPPPAAAPDTVVSVPLLPSSQGSFAVVAFPGNPAPLSFTVEFARPLVSAQGSPFAMAPAPPSFTVPLPVSPPLTVVPFPEAAAPLSEPVLVVFEVSWPVIPPETPVACILASASAWRSHTTDVPALLTRGRAKHEVPAEHWLTSH